MKKDGFTLVEIILAIAFLLIVMLMVVPNMYTMISKNSAKQLEKTEELIMNAAERYIGEDRNTAHNLRLCGQTDQGAFNDADCPAGPFRTAYGAVYLSLNDMARLNLVSANLKDPTQNDNEYDYTKIVEIKYNSTAGKYVYRIDEKQNIANATDKTLYSKLFLATYHNVWYSGLSWKAYKISTLDDIGTGGDDYIHLYLNETDAPFNALTCADLEGNLNNYKYVLARRWDDVNSKYAYCVNKDSHDVTIVLKNNQMIIGGTGEIEPATPPYVIYSPFLLLGDYYGKEGQEIGERYVGEYIEINTVKKRIKLKKDNLLELDDGSTISINQKITTVSNNLGIGTQDKPYVIGAD